MLIGAPEGVCSQCAVDHEPHMPHDCDSLRYQYAFYAEHQRWATWSDAIAHCDAEIKRLWAEALADRGIDL